MVLVLDSDTIPERERLEALNAVFSDNEVPQTVSYAGEGRIRHRMELFDLGPGVHLLRNAGTGLHIVRSPRHVRRGAPEQLAVFMQTRGSGLLTTDTDVSWLPGRLGILDTSRPYTYRQSDHSEHKVLLIDPGQLALPVDVIRAAAPALTDSPLYALVQAHIRGLGENSARLGPDAMAMVGRATAQLIRALVTTAAGDVRRHDALEATQVLRITAHIDAHLHDPRLNADRIAAAHNISTRQLYNVWARSGHDTTLSVWVIRRRLERARNQLTDLDPRLTTIGAIAHGCGFANMSHFSQRFRAAYGISPREWRSISRSGA